MTTEQAGSSAPADAAGGRDQFIPVRKVDLLDTLIEHGLLADAHERDDFRRVCRLLAAIYHHEYFELLERLRHDYYYFNPELELHARVDVGLLERAYADLVASFAATVADANFVAVPHAHIAHAHKTHALTRVALEVSLDDFREVRFFRRGHHTETIERAGWLGLRSRKHEVTVYDDVILFAAMKSEAEIASGRERTKLARRRMRPGSVLIKYFRNIAANDLNALFPNVRIVMSVFDMLFLSVPALAGAIPILINLASTVVVLFLVIGFYLGVVATVEHDQLKRAFAAMSGLVALIGFVMRQWLRYQRQSLKYQKEVTDNVYFHNINNNAGIFDYLIGEAEEQECKEAFLAYYFLRTAKTPPTQIELERRIEAWLKETFDLTIQFKISDALARLDRLGLFRRDGERLAVPPPDATIARLAEVWGGFFQAELQSPAAAAAG
jgi:hypothetical protein